MSLATSCPSCGTVFKVVEDQLKISEGWVRCGHCHDVFNALEGLFDLQRKDSALGALAPPASRPPAVTVPAEGSPSVADTVQPEAATTTLPLQSTDAQVLEAPVPEVHAENAAARGEAPTTSPDDGGEWKHPAPVDLLEADTVIPGDALLAQAAVPLPADGYTHDPWPATEEAVLDEAKPAHKGTLASGVGDDSPGSPQPGTVEAAPMPSFVHQARRGEFGPVHRRFAWAATGVLGAALMFQVTWHWRADLAARSALARTPLQLLSSALGYPLTAPAQADAVDVENAALTHPPGASGYKLSVQVRNRKEHEVAAPHMELSLTDGSGALLARRVLRPDDFQQAAVMSPLAEATWALEFQADERKVAGYAVLAFYP